MRLNAEERGTPLGAIFAGLGILACLATGLFHLDGLGYTVCAFKAATGLPCATCGSTRVLGRLFALDLPGAVSMNPLVAGLTFALVPWGVADLVLLARGRFLALRLTGREAALARIAAVAAVVANWAYLILAGR